MEAAELDVALEELELRLERLRALYEQYFMGIERIEPGIARKDVDRRIYVLRREKIRNTAKRFKLQTIIQRYNTFQQYWQRICREIENGTYKRHLLKVQKDQGQLLTIAARKRLGRAARTSEAPQAVAPSQPPQVEAEPPSELPAAARAPAASAPTVARAPDAARAGPPGAPPLPRRPPLPARPVAGAPGAEPSPATASAPMPVPAAAAVPVPAPAKPVAPARPAPAKFESLDLDMDFMGDWDPSAGRGSAPKAGPSRALPGAAPPTPVAKPAAAPVAKPAAPPVAKPAAPPVAKPVAAPVAKPASTPVASPLAPRPGSIAPAPVAAPPRPASSRPPTAPARPPAARIPPSPRVAATKPVAAIPTATAIPKPAPAPAPAASASNVDDARLRELHTRLQQAKQQTKEANVSYEGLAKSIRATEAKLREQHKNRNIDFDVVIKDGKAVVKPIVR